eukprot:344320-Prymnesium_polylepis.1
MPMARQRKISEVARSVKVVPDRTRPYGFYYRLQLLTCWVLHPDLAPPPSKTDTHLTVRRHSAVSALKHARAVVEGAGGAW